MTPEQKILDTLSTYVEGPIRKAGPVNVIMRCPFHSDRSPSFAMSTQTGLYICYACGEKGTFKQFLYKVGLTREQINHHYGRTLEVLKENAPPPPDIKNPDVVVRDTNAHIPNDILGIFHQCPEALLDEGFELETLEHFGIGVDETHDRITFPIRDLAGNLVGISGRAFGKQKPRYKVYKEEYRKWDLPPYDTDKSHFLWNAHNVSPRRQSARKNSLIIVEGFKACMWLWQAGYEHVVALMTKTMSWHQQVILRRLGGPYVLMLDNDEAGLDGYVKVGRELSRVDPDVLLVEYDAPQPTDVPLQDLHGLIQKAVNYQVMAYLP